MMKIDHLALWCDDPEEMRAFYMQWFGCTSNELYRNQAKRFRSYFLSFGEGGARIELMHRDDIVDTPLHRGFTKGMAHFDIAVGDRQAVDLLTERMRAAGVRIASEPRRTGDGCYESAILDPEGNYVELSAE